METSDTMGEKEMVTFLAVNLRLLAFFMRNLVRRSGVSGSEVSLIELLEEIWYYMSDGGQTSVYTDGLSAIATRLSTLLLLDSCTTAICMQTSGRMDYLRALVDIRADRALKDTMDFRGPLGIKQLDDFEKPIDDLVHDTREKMKAPPMKTPRKKDCTDMTHGHEFKPSVVRFEAEKGCALHHWAHDDYLQYQTTT
uniref:Zinc knuckle CX2CX4HX4C n=1 Tax=Tanacetum cinerariifolium TaxID=118510 RepID=A0A6L2NFT9_TANCI|nr:zinc knuckle CX2CX4HX4C [Tanacetum cinerariifolium]